MEFWQQVIISLFTVVLALVGLISYQQRVEKKNGNPSSTLKQIVDELKMANEKLSNIDKHLDTQAGVSLVRYDSIIKGLERVENKVGKA